VREFRKESNKFGSSIENRQDWRESDIREADKKRVAVIRSRADKDMYYNSIVVMVDGGTDLRIALRHQNTLGSKRNVLN